MDYDCVCEMLITNFPFLVVPKVVFHRRFCVTAIKSFILILVKIIIKLNINEKSKFFYALELTSIKGGPVSFIMFVSFF